MPPKSNIELDAERVKCEHPLTPGEVRDYPEFMLHMALCVLFQHAAMFHEKWTPEDKAFIEKTLARGSGFVTLDVYTKMSLTTELTEAVKTSLAAMEFRRALTS